MKNGENQPIIDAMLDEWLGNQKPSELSVNDLGMQRINPQRAAELNQALQAATNDMRNRSLASSAALYRKPKTYLTGFRILAMLAACLVVGAGVWVISNRDQLDLSKWGAPPVVVANNESSQTPNTEKASSGSVADSDSRKSQDPVSNNTLKPKAKREALPLESLPFNVQESVATKSIPSAKPTSRGVKLDEQAMIKVIDRGMQQVWSNHGAIPAAPIAGLAWIERITNQLLSRPASQEEKDFLAKKDNVALRLELIHRIVESAEFSQVWGRRLATFYLDADPASMRDMTPERRAFVQWIRKELTQSRGLDKVVKNIVLGEGINGPNAELPPSAHWWSELGLRSKTAPAEVIASKLLGTRASCSRCHDSSTVANADQVRFWGVAAITNGIEVSQPNINTKPVTQFRNEAAPLFYERDDSTMVSALPELPNGHKLKTQQQGSPAEIVATTRQNLASLSDWMLQSDELARSHVDFVWKSLFGQALVGSDPLDASEGRQERMELAAAIGQQLRSNDYDLKKLVTWITASKAFGLESIRPDSGWYLKATDKELSTYRHRQLLFASYPVKQDTSFRSIDKLAKWFDASRVLGSERGNILANRLPPTLQSGKPTKPVGGNATPIVNAVEFTESQVQYLVNSQLLPKAIQAEVDRMVKSNLPWSVLVDHAFYMTGTLPPNQVERDAAQRILDMSHDKRLALSRIIAAKL